LQVPAEPVAGYWIVIEAPVKSAAGNRAAVSLKIFPKE
jgi:hypothetical protein